MKSADILGVRVDAITKPELLTALQVDLKAGKRVRIVTVTTEIIMRAVGDPAYLKTVNAAEYRIPDSVGTLWAATYLAKPLHGPFRRIRLYTQAWWLLVWLAIWPSRAKRVITETVPGSDLSLDLAVLAAKSGYGLYLLGGGPGTAEAAAAKLRARHPRLKVDGSEQGRYVPSVAADRRTRAVVAAGGNQVVLVAYGAPKQEQWIARNIGQLPKPVIAVGVGGTLDYIAGTESVHGGGAAKPPPSAVRRHGFEWLWRLFTQPSRWSRIITAFPRFVGAVVRQKRSSLEP